MLYSREDFYTAIEQAAISNKAIVFPNGGYLRTLMISRDMFLVEDLYWQDGQNIYRARIQVEFRSKDGVPGMYVEGSTALDGLSSGDTSMFRKENRYKSEV